MHKTYIINLTFEERESYLLGTSIHERERERENNNGGKRNGCGTQPKPGGESREEVNEKKE